MKWINGYTYMEQHRRKHEYLGNWHRYFAWHPVVVNITEDHREIKVWLVYVERKGVYRSFIDDSYWVWYYREIQ